MPDSEDFERLTNPFRRELLAHCYRMLGSVHDAEDLLQETFLRAWRSYGTFDGQRASLRTWLYRIATNACLTALEQRSRRPLPSWLGNPSDTPEGPLDRRPEVPWLEPFPDVLLGSATEDPAAVVALRSSVRLAFVASLQHLPAKQRAVLILRDVLALRAAEVAELLQTTTASVNSALQRARAQLAQVSPTLDEVAEPTDADQRQQLDRYVEAFVNGDVTTLEQLLTDEIVLEMPPVVTWFAGRGPVGRFFAARIADRPGAWRMITTSANGQPAVVSYLRGDDGIHHAHSVHVLTITGSGISHITAFQHPSLITVFGLPLTLPAASP
ncbi:MAG TPA: sigma-70 family RNA polymerase sigma factor [Streptosporangiaceae bacterium]